MTPINPKHLQTISGGCCIKPIMTGALGVAILFAIENAMLDDGQNVLEPEHWVWNLIGGASLGAVIWWMAYTPSPTALLP